MSKKATEICVMGLLMAAFLAGIMIYLNEGQRIIRQHPSVICKDGVLHENRGHDIYVETDEKCFIAKGETNGGE